MKMKFGTFLAPYHRVGENPRLTMRRDLELIQWCDELGMEEAWVGEHHSAGWENIGDPSLFIAAAGERTKRIKIGSGVTSLPYHHPLMVADRFAQLSYMTDGRAMLGVGPGALVSDAVMMGIDPVTQRPRMEESLGVIIRLLNGEVVTHQAEWFTLNEARLQLLPFGGPLEIAVASTTSPAGTSCAGKYGVGVLSLGAGLLGGKMDLAGQWQIGQEAAAKHGKELRREDWRLVIRVHLAESREEAMRDVAEGREFERHHYFRRVAGLKNDSTLEQEIAEDTVIVGTPDDMIAAVERLQEATGGFGTFLVLAHDWTTREKTLHSYELMARFVVPHFQGMLDPVRASYDTVVAHKRDFGGPAMAAIAQAFKDAGKELPEGLTAATLR
ncbi:MAG: LLM class flavin-dependent oxidoreductase [Dehalococcoidia bacterium]|nr:LLM class flavin-dependent oxidoreductase [Dehalococcoidia bacterium]